MSRFLVVVGNNVCNTPPLGGIVIKLPLQVVVADLDDNYSDREKTTMLE